MATYDEQVEEARRRAKLLQKAGQATSGGTTVTAQQAVPDDPLVSDPGAGQAPRAGSPTTQTDRLRTQNETGTVWGGGGGDSGRGQATVGSAWQPAAGLMRPPPQAPAAPPPPPPQMANAQQPLPDDINFDDALYDWQVNQLGGPRDTSAEEALMRQNQEAMLGQSLVDQRASMGRAGFGSSGALYGMENAARMAAARDLSQSQFDLRDQARQEELDRVLAASSSNLGLRKIMGEEKWRETVLGLIEDEMKKDDEEPPPSGDVVTDTLQEPANDIGGFVGGLVDQGLGPLDEFLGQTALPPGTRHLPPGTSPPPGSRPIPVEGGGTLYETPDGQYFFVPDDGGGDPWFWG